MIDEVIKVFILEDRSTDVELNKRYVLKFAPQAVFTVAQTKEAFLERIAWQDYDIILADYHLPDYNGLTALLHVREYYPDTPFVFVTGMLNDEQKSAEAILNGANGYVLKENLRALEGSVKHALSQAAERREKARDKADRAHRRNMLLQKAIHLVKNSDDFAAKQAVSEALVALEAL